MKDRLNTQSPQGPAGNPADTLSASDIAAQGPASESGASGPEAGPEDASAGACAPARHCRVLLVRLARPASDPAHSSDAAAGRGFGTMDHAVPMGPALDAVLAFFRPDMSACEGYDEDGEPLFDPARRMTAADRAVARHLADHPAGTDWLSAALADCLPGCASAGPLRHYLAALNLAVSLDEAEERGVEYVCAMAREEGQTDGPTDPAELWETMWPEQEVLQALRDPATPPAENSRGTAAGLSAGKPRTQAAGDAMLRLVPGTAGDRGWRGTAVRSLMSGMCADGASRRGQLLRLRGLIRVLEEPCRAPAGADPGTPSGPAREAHASRG
ncbi:MAG: hypothetical protein Q4F72_11735 [Desulfovibrionaceae bacterium]|nr:hypothetical protein [Desulfovibrionaceae bacterium]